MFSIKLVAIIALVFSVALADDHWTEQNEKDGKMLFCAGCKDENVFKTNLKKFYECLTENFKDDYKRGEKIHKDHEKDPDACWPEMKKLVDEAALNNEENKKKMADCFKTHIPDRKVLEKCF